MSDYKDKAILEFALQMIEEAEQVISRYSDAASALSDIEGKNAILFNLLQIGEKLNKIKSIELRESLPIKETYSLRNRLTHDYDGVDLLIVEQVLIHDLPVLKRTILDILS